MAREMTTKAQEAIASALQAASAAGNPQVEPIHLLQSLIEQRDGIALSLLGAVGADTRAIGARTVTHWWRYPVLRGICGFCSGLAHAARRRSGAEERAESAGDQYISTEHLLIALAASNTEGGAYSHRRRCDG